MGMPRIAANRSAVMYARERITTAGSNGGEDEGVKGRCDSVTECTSLIRNQTPQLSARALRIRPFPDRPRGAYDPAPNRVSDRPRHVNLESRVSRWETEEQRTLGAIDRIRGATGRTARLSRDLSGWGKAGGWSASSSFRGSAP